MCYITVNHWDTSKVHTAKLESTRMGNWKANLSHALLEFPDIPAFSRIPTHLMFFQGRLLCLEGPSVYQPSPRFSTEQLLLTSTSQNK